MLESVLASVLNRFLAPYVDGLNTKQLNVGIWSGDVKLRNLRLKRSALDKFRLPVDVKEGYLGQLTLSIPWSNLKGKPVRVLVENVSLLASPRDASMEVDEKEEDERAQAAKQAKLEQAELFSTGVPAAKPEANAANTESFISSLVTKIVDNVQVTMRNIHLRYEDALSSPEHPFSIGFMLAELSAVSTDENWEPTFVQNSAGGIHKLARLDSLSVYWNTDSTFINTSDPEELQEQLNELIPSLDHGVKHQYLLEPVSGAGKLVIRQQATKDIPKLDAQLVFDQIGFTLDDEQYRDGLSVVDLFNFYARQARYRAFRPAPEELAEQRPLAMFRFAGRAILNEVHQKRRVWTWDYMRERRDDRHEYVRLYKAKLARGTQTNPGDPASAALQGEDGRRLAALEHKLSYQDIRFFRSIAKKEAHQERLQHAKDAPAAAAQQRGWLGWLWGAPAKDDEQDATALSEEQRKELYDAIEWDEHAGGASSLVQFDDLPNDVVRVQVDARLRKGFLNLRDHQHGNDILSLVFDTLQGELHQRAHNFDTSVSLGAMRVIDGTSPDSRYPQIVHVKSDGEDAPTPDEDAGQISQELSAESNVDNPFFYVKYEHKPLDGRADDALTLTMRSMQIVYHRSYVELVVRFFEPPQSELEVLGALIDVASETLEGIRKETRAGLENALENHKTLDMSLDVQAPIIVLPEDVRTTECLHVVLDAGHIAVRSLLVDQSSKEAVRAKQNRQYTEEDYRELEQLMYDRYFLKLESTQLVLGSSYAACMESLASEEVDPDTHLLERINLSFTLHSSIWPKAPNLTKFKMSGNLPVLNVHFSDRIYKTLLRIIMVSIPHLGSSHTDEPAKVERGAARAEDAGARTPQSTLDLVQANRSYVAGQLRGDYDQYLVGDDAVSDASDTPDEQFEDPQVKSVERLSALQQMFEFELVVGQVQGTISKSHGEQDEPDQLLVEAVFQNFALAVHVLPSKLEVDVSLGSLDVVDRIVMQEPEFQHIITSKSMEEAHNDSADEAEPATARSAERNLVTVTYVSVTPESPEYLEKYDGIESSVNVELSTIHLMLTRVSTLTIYDWIMTTFVPSEQPTGEQDGEQGESAGDLVRRTESKADVAAPPRGDSQKMRIRVNLSSVLLRLNDDGALLATLTLSTANVAVFLRGINMRVAARVGSLSLVDEQSKERAEEAFAKVLSIEGDELVDFAMETFDAQDPQYPGYDTSIWLRCGAIRLVFVQDLARDLVAYFSKFAKMKAVYDAATLAASAQATQLQERSSRTKYDILVKSPIVVLPQDVAQVDHLVAHLGEFYMNNRFEPGTELHSVLDAGLRQISLQSRLMSEEQVWELPMLEDVHIQLHLDQREERDEKSSAPPAQRLELRASISDISLSLTQRQYVLGVALATSVPEVLATDAGAEEDAVPGVQVASDPPLALKQGSSGMRVSELDREAQRRSAEPAAPPQPLFLDAHVNSGDVNLRLYSHEATDVASFERTSLFTFTLHDALLKAHSDPEHGLELEAGVKALTVADTRPVRNTLFREIVPATTQDGRQFMMNYSVGSQADATPLLIVTVDSPKFIFSLDPMFALVRFFTSGLPSAPPAEEAASSEAASGSAGKAPTLARRASAPAAIASESEGGTARAALSLRVNLVEPTVLLLATPDQADSKAIVLSVRQIVLTQQTVLALSVKQFGIFVWRMNAPKDKMRLLNNMDMSLAMESQARPAGSMASIEIDLDPMVIRLTFQDVSLLSDVVNNAIALSAQEDPGPGVAGDSDKSERPALSRRATSAAATTIGSTSALSKHGDSEQKTLSGGTGTSAASDEQAQVLVTREMLKIHAGGLQVIFISEWHMLPVLDVRVAPFEVKLSDWSADLRMKTSLRLWLNSFNLSTSHWEPLVETWTLDMQFQRSLLPASSSFTLSSPKRLDINVSETMIETANNAVALVSKQGPLTEELRHMAPFRIRNRTGYRLSVWSENEQQQGARHAARRVEDGRDMPWLFEDWKSLREQPTEAGDNRLAVHLDDTPWERVRRINVDREGEYVITLRPKLNRTTYRLLYDVKLKNNVKVITFRSTFNIDNRALIPIEVGVVDDAGEVGDVVLQISPGTDSALPIKDAYHRRLRIRPDPGFGYGWSTAAVGWQELMSSSAHTFVCPALHADEAPFRFQAFTIRDLQSSSARTYPKLTLAIRAPVEIENLLPYDLQYRLFDKNLNHNWSSFLRRGGVSPVHVVELSHLLLLSVELDNNVYSPSEFAIIASDNPDDFQVEHKLQLADSANHKLELQLHYHSYPDSGGAFKVQIYAPYIFLNQSQLPVAIRARPWAGASRMVAGQEPGANALEDKSCKPFLISRFHERRNRFLLRAGDSQWSKPLSFDVIGSEVEVAIRSAEADREAHFGLSIEDGLGKFKLSKVVKLAPRYMVWNTLKEAVHLREAGGGESLRIEAGSQVPLHWLHVNSSKQAMFAYAGAEGHWTAPFNINDVGNVFLRISRGDGRQQLLQVEVLVSSSTIFIKLTRQDGPWPFQLRNESEFTVAFRQCSSASELGDVAADEEGSEPGVSKQYVLKPRSKMKYAWDYPAAKSKYIKLLVNGRERIVNILEIGSLLPFRFPAGDTQGAGVLSLDVRADGASQTLILSPYSESESNFKVKRNAATRSDSLVPSMVRDSGFEAVDVDTTILSSYSVELAGVGFSIIDRTPNEIAYVTFRGLELRYSESQVTTAINVICKWIQIDNQMYGCIFPIVLYPTIVPKDGNELDVHPTLEASVIRLKDRTHGVEHVKYASVLIQELTAEVDENFLFAVYNFVRSSTRATAPQYGTTDYIENETSLAEPQSKPTEQDDVYFEILHLQPLALNLSFMATERVDVEDTESSRTLFSFIFNALTMALGNVNEAPVQLNALVIENVRLSMTVLQERIAYHYGQDFLFQVHRILGSADFLGNPVGLFNNVSSGVVDIFYEPYHGLVMHGNRELGYGIARGASNFVKKTVFGVSDSVAKLTGSISKGLAAATMDRDFQSRWRISRHRNKPKHALYGITVGANSLFTSVASGFEGLALRPLEGAEEGGTVGFVGGIGRGLVGAVTKPAVGVFDMASSVTEGLRNTTLVFEQNDIDRVRLPRFIGNDGIILPFSEREALGQMWLKNLDQGRVASDHYVAHVDSTGPSGGATIMLTENRILYIRTAQLRVLWEVVWSDLNTISLEGSGIALVLRGGVMGPFLPIPEASTRIWLFKQISNVVQRYNTAHA